MSVDDVHRNICLLWIELISCLLTFICLFPCLLVWWLPLLNVYFPFLRSRWILNKKWWNFEYLMSVSWLFWLHFVFWCSKHNFCPTSCTHCTETTPFIVQDLHCHCWTALFSINRMIQADVYNKVWATHNSFLAL